MLDKLEKIHKRYLELEVQLGDPQLIADQPRYQKLAKEFSDITPGAELYRNYKQVEEEIDELKRLLSEKQDKDFEELAKSELEEMVGQLASLNEKIKDILNPKKQEKARDVIVEIRAGTGGLEASLFAADLYRMYSRYAERKNWKLEGMGCSVSEAGGFKEVIFGMRGPEVSKRLKWESGVHRVQRVPVTEASGRIHTSAATVAVLFEPEEIEVNIDPKDLKIDVFKSSGPGGQSVNTTDSAVRITHNPTGMVIICQDERSQLKNKSKAMRVLRARLLDKKQQEAAAKETQDRKSKVGTGDRSEKIRTYNFPDHRVTDHRIGFSLHKLQAILDGDLDDLTDALVKAEEEAEEKLKK